jgi:hypothetical protein
MLLECGAVEGAPPRFVHHVLGDAQPLKTACQEQLVVQVNRFGQQLRDDLRTGAAGHGNPSARFYRSTPHQVDVRSVRQIQPDDVHDGQPSFPERRRQLRHRRDRGTRARDRHRGVIAGRVGGIDEVALHVDEQQGGRIRPRARVAIVCDHVRPLPGLS